MPDSLTFLNMSDQDGNLKIYIPQQYAPNASTTLTVFGPDIFDDNVGMSNFFTGTRTLSTYLFWAIFLFAIYRMGHNIYLELRQR